MKSKDAGNQRFAPAPGLCFCSNLRRALRVVNRVYEEEFRSAGFSGSTQYNVLVAVNRMGSIRQRDLGQKLDVDETTIARTLRPLFLKGWLTHGEGDDRREKWIAVTEAGKAQIEHARPAWERAQGRIKKVLPANLWDALMESLPKVAELGEGA
jgi:DNA-binding MarR family transcriptional regulator